MKYSFKDIVNEDMYSTALVMFVAGQYNIFNNIVVDELKERCKAEDNFERDRQLFNEFGIDDGDTKITVSNTVDFNTFMDVVGIPSVNGRWFCSVDIKTLNKKQRNILEGYMRDPSPNGILVIVSHEWLDFRWYLRNRVLQNSQCSHIIQLGFPNRTVLVKLTHLLFEKRNAKIDNRTAELFVMRMSSAYDDYDTVIDKICLGHRGGKLTHERVQEGLKGVDNYVLDDFIERILEPITKDKITPNRRIYKIYGALKSEMGAIAIVRQLMYKVGQYIEFRLAINDGTIPIKVRYSVVRVKESLGEEHPLYRIPDFRFRRMAYIASLTSLEDWTYIKMLLSDETYKYSEEASEKILYTLIHRTVLNKSRLNNSLKIEDIIDKKVENVDKIKYRSMGEIKGEQETT